MPSLPCATAKLSLDSGISFGLFCEKINKRRSMLFPVSGVEVNPLIPPIIPSLAWR